MTPDDCVVALIDHQPQMLFGTSNFDRQTIINNTVALAKATRVFDVPVVLTTVETKAFSGNLWPQSRAEPACHFQRCRPWMLDSTCSLLRMRVAGSRWRVTSWRFAGWSRPALA